MLNFFIVLIAFTLGWVIYIMPTLIAFKRLHKNRMPILILNLFLGWTLLGWVGSLVWSLTDQN